MLDCRGCVSGWGSDGQQSYADTVLDLDAIDVEEIATALADQTDYEHRWLIDPRTGEVAFWTGDTGIDGENPVELDELDLVLIDPLRPTSLHQAWSISPTASVTAPPASA